MTGIGNPREILDNTIDVRLLYDDACHSIESRKLGEEDRLVGNTVLRRNRHQFDTLMQSICVKHLARLRVQSSRHQHLVYFLSC